MDQLSNFVAYSPQAQAIQDGPESSSGGRGSRRRLNPAFTAWLQGLPWWWTNSGDINCAHSEMAQYRSALRSRSHTLLDGLEL